MPLTRRAFLIGSSAGAALVLGGARLAEARGLVTDPLLDDVVTRALAAAKKAGATYADVRIHRRRAENISCREERVQNVSSSTTYGVGVRVIAGGAWGYAATARVGPKEAEDAARRAVEVAKANARWVARPIELAPVPANVDVWQTPLVRDPFKVPLEDKVGFLLALNAEAMKAKGVRFANSSLTTQLEWKLLGTSDGAYIEQAITRIQPTLVATAAEGGDFQTVGSPTPPRQAGWEYVADSPMLAGARGIGEQAVEKLRAPRITPGKRDLVLAPSNLYLTIHESVGHPTELDRALGYEANLAGTSFATVEKLGKLTYAAPQITLYADRTTPGGLATCGYDDDGVATQRWNLVENGRFVGYQTTREQAGWIGEKASRGTCYAEDYAGIPFQRMPNVSLAPGPKARSLDDLVAATDDGVLVSGRGSWSIDHQRYNFQFGGQLFWEIKKGKRTRMVRSVAYQANSLDFWRSCDLIGGADSFELWGTMGDGKGEPIQTNAVGHGCPPARFRGVQILDTDERRGA